MQKCEHNYLGECLIYSEPDNHETFEPGVTVFCVCGLCAGLEDENGKIPTCPECTEHGGN
jgi:hypothetical protein